MPPILKNTGLTSAAAALHFYERRQQAIANNLANVNTTGFKKERVFGRMVDDAVAAADSMTDRSQGDITPTGNSLDVAMTGDAFLVVQTPDGERLTRGGSLCLDDQRRLVTSQGHLVLGELGPITLPQGDIGIGRDGIITVQPPATGEAADRGNPLRGRLNAAVLRIESIPANAVLQHAGGGLFLPDAGRKAAALADRQVMQGALEASNVNSIESLTEMIDTVRAYADVQKSITVMDDIRGIAANQIGKPV
ncbi:MAG: flagellar hook-basal body protein [Gemmatimonadaceae bacterium]|nr:flagellar hook-basal body protein [Gemmatimonadaceae bacterium]